MPDWCIHSSSLVVEFIVLSPASKMSGMEEFDVRHRRPYIRGNAMVRGSTLLSRAQLTFLSSV